MTIETTDRRAEFPGNDSATSFVFTFRAFDDAEFRVTHVNTDGDENESGAPVLGTDYSIAIDADGVGGTVSWPLGGSSYSTLATGETLIVERVTDQTQEVLLTDESEFSLSVIMEMSDRAVALVQELSGDLDRTPTFAVSVDLSSFDLDLPEPEADKLLAINAAGTGFEWVAGPEADDTIQSLADLATAGLVARQTDESVAARSIAVPTGMSIANADGDGGDPTISLADDLAALEAMSGTGLVARTASDTYAQRTIGTSGNGVSVSNGDGVSGAPSISLDQNLDDISQLATTDGGFIVGDGANFVLETGATARTSLGVGTGDTPQFTGVEIGHASDTTLTRVSAGLAAIEGDTIALLTATQTLTNKTLTSPTINSPAMGADSIDAITEIAAALKSGADGTLITGTAGTNGNVGMFNADGDLVDASVAATNILVDGDIGGSVQAQGDVLDDLNTLGASTADSEFLVATGAGALAWESGATARTSLGVAIGTDVQAFHAYLADIAGITAAQGDVIYFDGSDWVNLAPGTSGYYLKSQGAGGDPIWAEVSASTADQTARDNTLLNAWNIARLDGQSEYGLVNQIADVFDTEDAIDADFSDGYTHDAGNDYLHNPGVRITGGTPTHPLGGGTPANINDDDTGTSSTPTGFGNLSAAALADRVGAVIDYGSNKTVTKIEIKGLSQSAGSSTTNSLVYSTDGSSWTKLGADFTVTATPTDFSRTGSVTARYVGFAGAQEDYGAVTVTIKDLNGYETDASPEAIVVREVLTAGSAPAVIRPMVDVQEVDSYTINTDFIAWAKTGKEAFTTDYATDDKLDDTAHGLENDDRVILANNGGALPTGFSKNVVYYVVNKTTNDFELSLTSGGAAVSISDDGTGTHYYAVVSKATLSELSDDSVDRKIYGATVDVSGHPSSTKAGYALQWVNNKELNVARAGIQSDVQLTV